MIEFTSAQTEKDLRGILALQQQNLKKNISLEEKSTEGFVTVEHSYEVLASMNAACPSIVAKDGDAIVGYCITMLPAFGQSVPELVAMFNLFSSLKYKNRAIADRNYYVMGQICVAKDYRGQNLFAGMYQAQKKLLSSRFDLCITEVSLSNSRSMRAHSKLGFETIHTFDDPTNNETWAVVAWDWL
jgi:hypothetical protein